MKRRTVLSRGGAITCSACAALASRHALGSEQSAHWSYAGSTGPAQWGSLSNDYVTCSSGSAQSPVDLTNAVRAEVPPADIAWHAMGQYGVVNNGHTIQVNVPDGNALTLLDRHYDLLQFHFHHDSEHTVNGAHYPMEAHFVHRSTDGSLAVVGVFLDDGPANRALETIWGIMPTEPGEIDVADRPVDPNDLLPAARSAFLYYGSLTTPPCSEVVTWMVLDTPISASARQIAEFDAIYNANYRPVQPLNRRLLLFGG